MPLYLGTDDAGTSQFSLQDFEPSWGNKMNASVREAWLESYGPSAVDFYNSKTGDANGLKLSGIEAADAIKQSGLKFGKTVVGGEYTRKQLDGLLERQRELTIIKDVRERTPWDASSVLRGAAMFGAGMADPLNLATAFVPWTRGITALNATRAGLLAESFATRTASRAVLGGADAGISTAILEPAYSYARNDLGDDYGALDSMANIAFGTAFGGGVHVLGGSAKDIYKSFGSSKPGMITPDPMRDAVSQPPAGMVSGGETQIRIGETYEPARWSVVDADQLQATVGKADNQFRDRTRAAYQTEIQQRANNLDFNLLSDSPVMDYGAPTLAADGRIIGGNGRVLFVARAYEIGKGGEYKAALEARMESLGIDPKSVAGMVKPVLVRILQREVDVKRAAILSNEGGSTDMSPLEQAKVDAERMGEIRLQVGADGDLNAPENRGAVRAWVNAQPENKRNSLMDEDGRLSASGLQRLNAALLFKAYGDSPTLGRLIESMDPGSRNLVMALGRTAPVIANARASIVSGDLHPLDIASDIQMAVEKFNTLRESGMSVKDYLAQIDAFGETLTPEGLTLLEFMGRNIGSPRRMADAITGFYGLLDEAGNPKQADIFGGGGVPDKAGLLAQAIANAEQSMDTAAEVAAMVSPETREATLRASVAQSVDGRNVEVEAIIGLDPARKTATIASVSEATDRAYQPENVATADFDASAAVEARVAKSQKWAGVKDAESAMADADTVLNDTVAAGDQSFKYSRGEAPGQKKATLWQGSTDTPEGLTEALRLSFGKSTDALLEAGGVRVVTTPKDIPGGPHPADTKGATAPDGTVYIVASNVAEFEARGMLLHEVGVHTGMERMLGADVFQGVLRELDDAILRGDDWALAARGRVPKDTPAGLIREEQLAYLVQHAPELPIVQRIIAAVRAWAYRTFEFAQERMTLTEADFRAMAVSALHSAALGERVGGLVPAFSRAGSAADQFRQFVSANRQYVEDGLRRRLLATSDNYVIRPVPLDSVRLQQFGEDYINDSSVETAAQIKTGNAANRRPEDVFPILLDKDGLVLDGHHRHAAAVINGETSVLALVPVGPGRGQVLNLDEFGGSASQATRYCRGETPDPSTTKDEMQPYEAAVVRAKGYSKVLRAAADKLDNDAQATAAMKAAMPDLSPIEITDLLDGLRRSVKGLRGVARKARDSLGAEDAASGLQSEAMQAADDLANNLEMAAVIEKRNASLNMAARLKATAYVNQFRAAGLDFEGFRGLLVGTERKRAGGRISVEAEQKNFRGEWLGGIIADLEKAGLMGQFTSGTFDRDVSIAMWNLGRGEPAGKVSPEAVKIAEIVSKYQEDARNTRNRFGSWIRDLSGYITRQSHDMFKIRDVGEKAFKEFVLPRLDVNRSLRDFNGTADDFLTRVYDDFAAGTHMKAVTSDVDTMALGTGSSLAKRESVSRVLHFKDGNASFEYNEKFGQGRLAESVLQGLDQAGKSAGLLKILGTNPESAITRVFDEYAESLRGSPERRAKFLSHKSELQNLLSTVDGSSQIPGNFTAARISSFLRSWQAMAKLGGMLISSISDLSNYAAEMRFGQDKNLLSGTLYSIGALTRGRATGEKRAILASLGVFHESLLGAVYNRFDSPDLIGGKTAAVMQQFFKLSGINWWTEALRDGYALTHSNYLASNSSKSFAKLPASLRDMLGLYNIDAGKWDILRIATMKEADGRAYMTPDGLKTVPAAAIENYIIGIGRKVSDVSVKNLKDDLASALRTMTIDRMHHAVLEPSARARAFMLRGTQPGTVAGELLRFVTQFKSFPIALVQQTLGREVYGRGYDTIGDYIKRGKGDMVGLATFVALSTAMGYAAMSIKDLLKGKNPRPVDDPRTWAAALVQGGGMGIYGDFLFGKFNRMGGTLTGSLAGPVLNLADTVADLWTRIRTGDDVAAASFTAALQNTPFGNLFYTRAALDYLILYRMQESMNPGFLRRMERRAERENGQTFYLPPSQVAR